MLAIRREKRFQPIDSSDFHKQGGTGLALTIRYKTIEQHSTKIGQEVIGYVKVNWLSHSLLLSQPIFNEGDLWR